MAESSAHNRSHNISSSYAAAESGGHIDDDDARNLTPPHTPTLSAHARHGRGDTTPRSLSPSRLRFDTSAGYEHGHGTWSKSFEVNARSLGRAIVSRLVRAARRGNLPFLVIFMSCVVIFFSALAGIGYVDPDAVAPVTTAAQFVPGLPVFVPDADSEIGRRRKADALREQEKEWQRKRRPKDGAWMQRQRDDKAIRRTAPKLIAVPPPAAPAVEELDKREIIEDQRVYDLGGKDEAYDEGKAESPVEPAEPEAVGISADQLEQEQEEGIEISPEEKQAAVDKGGEVAEAVEEQAVIGEQATMDEELPGDGSEGRVL